VVGSIVALHDRYYFISRGTSPAEAGSKADQLELGGAAVADAVVAVVVVTHHITSRYRELK
jgi:hypothetical protein